jgi:hypothetical protein
LEQAIKKKITEKPKMKEPGQGGQKNIQLSVEKKKYNNTVERGSLDKGSWKDKEGRKGGKDNGVSMFGGDNGSSNFLKCSTHSKVYEHSKGNHRKYEKLISLVNYTLSSA